MVVHQRGHGSLPCKYCKLNHLGHPAGMLKVDGLLQSGCKMWDTPGVPHPYQLSSKLSAEEVTICQDMDADLVKLHAGSCCLES